MKAYNHDYVISQLTISLAAQRIEIDRQRDRDKEEMETKTRRDRQTERQIED